MRTFSAGLRYPPHLPVLPRSPPAGGSAGQTKVCEREVHEVVLVCHARTSPNARICREGVQG